MDPAPFLSLLNDGQQLAKVMHGIEAAIAASFAVDGARMTQSEIKRRFEICARLFKQLRGDLLWGVDRIVDHLPRYLRNELDGVVWEPDNRQCWIPSDGT